MDENDHYVRRHRKQLQLNQVEYAQRYGVSQDLVSKIERGERWCPKDMAVDVYLAFPDQVTMGQLNPMFRDLVPVAA